MATEKTHWKLQEFCAHIQRVGCAQLKNKDARILATGGDEGRVNVWEVSKPVAIVSLSGHTSPVESVRFSPEDDLLAAGAANGSFKIFDLEQAKVFRTLTGHKTGVTALEFHPFAKEFVGTGSADTNVKLFDLRRKGCIYTYKGHTDRINMVRFSPDGKWLVSASRDSTVKLWDLKAGKQLAEFSGHEDSVNSLEFHPKDVLLASASSDRTVKFWDLDTFACISSTQARAHPIRKAIFQPEGRCIYAASDGGVAAHGWEPPACLDSLAISWGNLADANFAGPQLVCVSTNKTQVTTWVVAVNQMQPLAPGAAPIRPGSALRRSFDHRPPTTSSSSAMKRTEEDKGDDSAATSTPSTPDGQCEIAQPEEYQKLIRPTTATLSRDPFTPPPDLPRVDPPKPTPRARDPAKARHSPSPRRTSEEPKKPWLGVGNVDAGDFMPPKPSQEQSSSEVLADVSRGHQTVSSVLQSRLSALNTVQALWGKHSVTTALEHAFEKKNDAVICDLLNVLSQRQANWNLDLCASIVPHLESLLSSKYESHARSAAGALKIVLRLFSHVIKSNLTLPPSAGGVDVSREERHRKCLICYNHLQDLRPEIARLAGKNSAPVFKELQMLCSQLD